MLEAAVRALPANRTVGAILVPSSDAYIRTKMQHNEMHRSKNDGVDSLSPQDRAAVQAVGAPITFHVRAQLLHVIAREVGLTGFVHVSDAEQSRNKFYLGVLSDLAREAAAQVSNPPELIFVTGSDRPGPLWK